MAIYIPSGPYSGTMFPNLLQMAQRQGEENAFIKKTKKEVTEVYTTLSTEEATKLKMLIESLLFCLDVFETNVKDVDKLLSKAACQNYHISQYDDVYNSMVKCTNALGALHKDKTEDYELIFADEADKICDYLNERTRIFLKKVSKLPNKGTISR